MSDDPHALSSFHLFRATATSDTDKTPEQIANEILYEALQTLEARYGPKMAELLRLRFHDEATVAVVARQLNLADSTIHKKQREAIHYLATIIEEQEQQVRQAYLGQLEARLTLPPRIKLIGIETQLQQLVQLLQAPDAAWLIAVEGLGGIGKTALANAAVRELALTGRFYDIAWVSAKQQEFWPDLGPQPIERPALDRDMLLDTLLEQLDEAPPELGSPQQKLARLTELLKRRPYLVVIDNLETLVDYQPLLPLLRQLAHPTKFLLTSRLRPPYDDITHFKLKPLSRTDTHHFLRHEAQTRSYSPLLSASEADLDSIYDVVGGNPLALKLVVGQLSTLPLSIVLEGLKQAEGHKPDALYTYIYWQSWQLLDSAGRQTLVSMPLAQNGTLEQVAVVSRLERSDLHHALEQLTALSLLETGGDIEQRTYAIHRLTETFLLNEVIKWQASA
jgi:hypothetical protein